MLAPTVWAAKPQEELEKVIQDIRSGLVKDSFVLHDGKWVEAYGGKWYKEDSKAIIVEPPGPKKPVPVVPFEIFQDPEKVKNIDYMAAVRAMCKGK